MPESPVARGVYLCETVIVEERSRNVSLINCFTRRLVSSFPSPPQQFVVYAVVANGQGTMPVSVQIVDLTDGDPIYDRQADVTFPSPLTEARFMARVAGLVIARPGWYEVSLSVGGEVLSSTRFEMSEQRS